MNTRSVPAPSHQPPSTAQSRRGVGSGSPLQLSGTTERGHAFELRPPRQFGLRPPRQSLRPAERGYVTAETAMVLPTLVGLGLALVLIVVAAAAQLRCTDAAWEAARGLARGEPTSYAAEAVQRFGPAGASTEVSTGGGSVLVRVSARLPLGNALLPALHVVGHAQIACEPGSPCAGDGIGQEVR